MSRNCMPPVITSRSIWYWAHVEPSASVMDSAVEAGLLGIQRRPSGLSGGWKKTKAGSTDFGGYSDNSSSIWWEQQRMDVRASVASLPFYARASGMVMYAEFGQLDLKQLHNHIYRQAMQSIRGNLPGLPPEQRAKVLDLVYCAICHYHQAISPAIEGGTARSMQPELSQLKALMAGRGNKIDTRRWSRQWCQIWNLIIDEIRQVDRMALAPVSDWIQEYLDRHGGDSRIPQ